MAWGDVGKRGKQRMQERNHIRAIDTHCHVFPDSLAQRAISTLEESGPWRAVGDGTRAGLLASMDAAGINKAVACMIATRPGQEKSILAFCRQLRSERIVPFASVHPDSPDAGRWIEKIAEAGLGGIKVHPMYQDCPLDDSRMDPIFSAAAANNLLVTIHSGRDIAFPEDDRASAERIVRVVKRHRKVRFIATHLGGWQSWDQVSRHLLGLGMYVECSFSLQFLPVEDARKLIHGFGADRVMLGSDWPWVGQAQTIQELQRLDLCEAEMQAILYQNAAGLLKPAESKPS